MKHQFSFSEVEENQLSILQELSEKTFRATYQHLNEPEPFEAYVSDKLSLKAITQQWSTPMSRFFLAWNDDAPIGYYKLNLQTGAGNLLPASSVELERIYLIASLQGKGLGAQLIEDAQLKAKQAQYDYLWLGVWSENPKAIRFYEKHGFEIFGEHTFMMGPEPQKDYLMKKQL